MMTQGGLESDVALKVLRRDLNPSGQSVQRLRDEGRLLARLDHPVILRVHDLAVLEGRVALITEYIAGEDLETLSGRRGPGRRGLLEIVAKVAHALDAAWNAPLRDGTPLRLVHRDIKPSNIRVGKHGEVKLLDFGIARTDALSREARTQTDMMVGSPAYMAPERFRGTGVEPASDVFSLGVTLLEGLTGRRFYARLELPRIAALSLDQESFEEHLEQQLAAVPDDVPDELRALVADALCFDHTRRITAAELADRAERLAEDVGGDSLQRWSRAHRWRPEREEQAEMSGRTLTEGSQPTLAPRTSAPPEAGRGPTVGSLGETAPVASAPPVPSWGEPVAERRSGPSPWLLVGLATVVVGAGLAGLLTAGAGGLAFNWWRAGALGTETPVEQPAEVQAVGEDEPGAAAEQPTPAPESAPGAPAPAAQPEPVSSTPVPRPAPVDVAPPAPEPEPQGEDEDSPDEASAPAPAPAPEDLPAGGYIEVEGGIPVVAVGDAGRQELPGVVPAGHYEIEATFPGGSVVRKPIDVGPGDSLVVSCGARMQNCNVSRQ